MRRQPRYISPDVKSSPEPETYVPRDDSGVDVSYYERGCERPACLPSTKAIIHTPAETSANHRTDAHVRKETSRMLKT